MKWKNGSFVVLFLVFLISVSNVHAEITWSDSSYWAGNNSTSSGAYDGYGIHRDVCNDYGCFPTWIGDVTAGSSNNSIYVNAMMNHPGYGGSMNSGFNGYYTAVDPFLQFSYDWNYTGITGGSGRYGIDVYDYSSSTPYVSIYSYSDEFSSSSSSGSNSISIPVPVSDNLLVMVHASYGINSSGTGSGQLSLNYNLDSATSGSPVAPEPISSILFVTGGTLLAGRRFIRRKA